MHEFSQINTELGNRFSQHLSAINRDVLPTETKTLWRDIAVRYNETQRAYHTLRHVRQLFEQFEQIVAHLHKPHLIALALYYHDVIYNPTRSDNELKSAEHAVDKLKGYLNEEQCRYIYALILMTATHQLSELTDDDKRSDAAYLLDMDLSVLGTPWPEYERYARAVRQEYAHISVIDYRIGRVTVLQKLLAHPKLYLTSYYYERLEQQARENMEREISLLRAS